MNKSQILLLVSVILAIGSMSARAAKFQVDYVMLEADLEGVEEFEPTAIQFKYINPIDHGTDLMAVFAIGISDDDIEEFDPFFGTVKLGVELGNLIGIYGRAHTNSGSNTQFFGQLGLVQIKYDLDAEISGLSGSDSFDEIGLAFGFGASFGLSDQSAIVIEYNQFPDVDIEDIADIETTSLSVGYQASF